MKSTKQNARRTCVLRAFSSIRWGDLAGEDLEEALAEEFVTVEPAVPAVTIPTLVGDSPCGPTTPTVRRRIVRLRSSSRKVSAPSRAP